MACPERDGEGTVAGNSSGNAIFQAFWPVLNLFLMMFGRTELMISASNAKFDEEADFEVHRPPNPQNPNEKRKKLFFRTENFCRKFFFAVEK